MRPASLSRHHLTLDSREDVLGDAGRGGQQPTCYAALMVHWPSCLVGDDTLFSQLAPWVLATRSHSSQFCPIET